MEEGVYSFDLGEHKPLPLRGELCIYSIADGLFFGDSGGWQKEQNTGEYMCSIKIMLGIVLPNSPHGHFWT